ncbi:MAG: D-glycero-beta-D-manno-heptose-7-phosphate kinase [Salibacteraceae bacterium]
MTVEKLFQLFRKQNIIVIGDVILDAYMHGRADRISPEAPVSILDVESKSYRLGGAANVALNVHALGANPILCSIIGSDLGGQQILDLMTKSKIGVDHVHASAERRTSVKTRLMSANRQMMRIDEEQNNPLAHADEEKLLQTITEAIAATRPDAIIFEDYDKGVITPVIIERVISLARKHDIPVSVDPKKRNFLSYSGATLFKPNLKELKEGLNNPNILPEQTSLKAAFDFLMEVMPVDMALFTLSSHGMFITNGEFSEHVPTKAQHIADVSGAGDTVIATATCALAAGCTMSQIANTANSAAGIVCQQPGVVAIDATDLRNQLSKEPWV